MNVQSYTETGRRKSAVHTLPHERQLLFCVYPSFEAHPDFPTCLCSLAPSRLCSAPDVLVLEHAPEARACLDYELQRARPTRQIHLRPLPQQSQGRRSLPRKERKKEKEFKERKKRNSKKERKGIQYKKKKKNLKKRKKKEFKERKK